MVASLLDGCDIVLLRPPDRPSAQLRRKLEAVARRYGSVLLVAGEWDGAQARLRVARHEWAGIGAGHGRLRARKARSGGGGPGHAAADAVAVAAGPRWRGGHGGRVTAADRDRLDRRGRRGHRSR